MEVRSPYWYSQCYFRCLSIKTQLFDYTYISTPISTTSDIYQLIHLRLQHPIDPVQGDWWSAGGNAPQFWLADSANVVLLSVLPPPVVFFFNVTCATSIDETPLGNRQSPFAPTASRFRILLLFAEDCKAGVAKSIPSERLEDVPVNGASFSILWRTSRYAF